MVYHTLMRKVYHTYKRKTKKSIVAGLSIALCVGQFSLPVYAIDEEAIKTCVGNATYLLEQAIKESIDQAEQEVKDAIVRDNLDYKLTMDSFYEEQNPYIESDYLDFIAAFMVVFDNDHTKADDFYKLPFIDVSIDQEQVEEYIPEKVPVYKARDGNANCYELDKMVYVYEPIEIPVYEKQADGYYCLSDQTEMVNLIKHSVRYGRISMCGMTYQDIFKYYGLTGDKIITEFRQKKEKLEKIISGKGINESVFIKVIRTDLLTEDIKARVSSLNEDNTINNRRKHLLHRAISMIGKIPYQWGGKATNGDYDSRWWTIGESGVQRGLDCSGFVQWCFMDPDILVSLTKINGLLSTQSILKTTTPIIETDLMPGDLGLLHNGTQNTTNHVGIYLGNHYWIHCSSASGTVVAEKTDIFKVFRKMPENDSWTDDDRYEAVPLKKATPISCEYTDEDAYLLAQLCYNEANTEGINGWIAVAEVVKNRVNSPLFPNSIREVIYQKNPAQFSNSKMIEKREPTEEQIRIVQQVLNGTTGILNDESVLYFKNAGGSTENWGDYSYYMTVHHHQFYRQE